MGVANLRRPAPDAAGELAKPPLYPAAEQLLDLPHFSYLLNADPCEDEDVEGVLIVTSHAGHVELRSAHRRAYPRVDLLGLGLRRVFLLARQPQHQDDADRDARALRDEGRRFKDIVQGDFVEAYRNLTYKHTMGLLWATRYCPQARLVIKMDDDIVVDLYQFVDVVKKHQQQRRHQEAWMFGYVLRGLQPSREPANKWFVTRAEYAGDAYPDFVSGWLYAAPAAVARALAAAAARWTARAGYFWIDDLLLTGMVRETLGAGGLGGVQLHDARELYTVHPEVIHCCLAEPDLRCDVLVGPNGGDNDLIVRSTYKFEHSSVQILKSMHASSICFWPTKCIGLVSGCDWKTDNTGKMTVTSAESCTLTGQSGVPVGRGQHCEFGAMTAAAPRTSRCSSSTPAPENMCHGETF
ncbi:hypothetical protein FOCC_FOCC011289 [Frankliniella occidentalis]|nr:hypothetical protein FOCC_FOCC011289 [Frankliniella occidentalis]